MGKENALEPCVTIVNNTAMKFLSSPPPSSSSFLINLVGGIFFVASVFCFHFFFPELHIVLLGMAAIGVAFIPIVLGEIFILKSHLRPSVGLVPRQPLDKDRVMTKLIGYYAALMLVGLGYVIVPGYRSNFYNPAWNVYTIMTIPYLVGGWIYVELMDRHMANPFDGLWHFGSFVRGRWHKTDKEEITKFVLSILLRAYYLPIMILYLMVNLNTFTGQDFAGDIKGSLGIVIDPSAPGHDLIKLFLLIYFLFATMDALFATLGYLCVFRPLDTHIRSLDPTPFGWFICIVCYFPFWEKMVVPFLMSDLFRNMKWSEWLSGHPVMIIIWGSLIVIFMLSESLMTLTFGMRFSNLTYRGLISAGPYRWLRHPHYLAKVINRFFFLVPFVSPLGFADAAKRMILFFALCSIYFLRARTEENHLSRYPEYVEYAKWVDEHGLLRGIKQFLPFLKFSKDRAQSGRLIF